MIKNGISIIICCYNSSIKLYDVIKHINSQENYNFKNLEVIFIDNNSNDNTKFIIYDIIHTYKNINILYKFEHLKGQTYARNTGINNSNYRYILFCDDDNLLSNNYLYQVNKIFNENDNIGLCGGKSIELINADLIPKWFEGFKSSFAIGSQITNPQITLFGAGMACRRIIFDHFKNIGFNLTLIGRNSNILTSGDDSEIVCAAKILGFELFSSNDFYFYHKISINRLNYNYLCKLYFGFGKMTSVLVIYNQFISNKKILPIYKYYLLYFKVYFKSLFSFLFLKWYHKKVFLMYNLGILTGFISFIPHIKKLLLNIHILNQNRIK
jgi:glycosyltransferase involved in cell wall biosynthesis